MSRLHPAVVPAVFALVASLSSTVSANSVSKGWISEPVRDKLSDFQACMDSAMRVDPKFAGGRVTTRFVIQTTGEVSHATTTSNTAKSKPLAACVRRVFKSLDYGEEVAKRTTVTYPLYFEVKKDKSANR